MSERTLEQAMAHAAIIRQNGSRYDREESPHEFDVVLLADEILRLRVEEDGLISRLQNVHYCNCDLK